MKLRNYFLTLGLLLTANIASAAIVEREKPVFSPNPVEVKTDGTYMYMYNVGAKQFFRGANDWQTRASVGNEGYKVFFQPNLVDDAWDGSTVYFWNYVETQNTDQNVFFDNAEGYCYVDRASQPNYYWKLEKNADNDYYRLSMAECNESYADWYITGTYFGWDAALDNGTNTRLWAFLDPTIETNHVDWAFISEEDYQAHLTDIELFNQSELLKEQLLLAAEMGVTNISEQEAIYNNPASTLEELAQAITSVKWEIIQHEEITVDASNPVDKTSLIVNANYDENTHDGWNWNTWFTVNHGVAESYNNVFDTYQYINNIPNGVYAVTVRGYFRPYNTNEAFTNFKPGAVVYGVDGSYAYEPHKIQSTYLPSIFAGSKTTPLGLDNELEVKDADGNTWYVPNDMETANVYLNDAERGVEYETTVMFNVENGYMRFGIKQESLLSNADWTLWDNWKLTYYGKSVAAYQKWAETVVANAPDYSHATITQSLKEEYVTLLATMSATNATEAIASMELLNAMLSEIKTNEMAWKTYAKAVDKAKNLLAKEDIDPENESVQSLRNYVDQDAVSIMESRTLGTAEVLVEAAELEYQTNETAIQSMDGNSVDVTDLLLTNYDFENTLDGKDDGAGWEGSWTAFGGTDENQCMEAYGMTFDVHQEAKGAPVGIYEVSLQGFFRIERGQSAYDLYLSGDQLSPGGVYVNNNMNLMKCVFDEPVRTNDSIFSDQALATGPESNPSLIIDAATGDSLYFPNNMLTAGEAFAAGMYVSKARGLVAKAGDELRIGVKGSLGSTTWAIWDNFKVVYHGKQPEYVKSYLQDAVANANDNLNKRIGKEIKEALTARIATGEAALANGDGEVMFNALVGLYDISDSTQTSISTINPVYLAAKELLIASKMSMGTQREEAATLAQTIMDGIEAYDYNTDEMAELLNQIQNMKWQLPPVNGGSDQSGNYFCIASEVEFFKGLDMKLPIFMLNDDDITAFQCDIYLPEGLRLKMNEDEDYNITLSERATSSHSVATSDQADGSIRVAVYSSKSKPFRENIGELFTLDLEYVEGATDPQLVEIRNIYLSTADEREFNPNNIASVVTIKDYTLGDVNNDGIINENDTEFLARHIAYGWEITTPAADIDTDHKISIGDVVGVSNIMLGNDITPPADDDEDQTANVLKMDDIVTYKTDSYLTYPVTLANENEITAFQCDIKLSDNFGSANIYIPDEVSKSHCVIWGYLSDNMIRVVGYSNSNIPLKENSTLFFVDAFDNTEAKVCDVKICNIRMSTAEGYEFGAPDVSATITLKDYIYGDVNNDGYASLLDHVAHLNAQMGKPSADYTEVPGAWEIANICLNNTLPANGEGGVEQTDNVFKVENAEVLIGNELVLPIRMINKDFITAFQCDIYLSEGLQFETADIDRYTSHNNLSVTRPDGAIRWISYGAQNSPFNGNDGDLLILKLTAKEGASETQTVEIRNIRLVTPDEREFTPADITATVTVKEYLPADANGDYKISIVDVVAVVNNLLGDESDNFVFKAADMDGNGKITIVDVVAVVNTLLGNSPKMATARAIMHSDIHVADAEVNAGETTTLYVQLDNAQAYTAMQMDVNLPEGLSIEDVRLMGNPAHTVANNEGSIVAYSLANRTFNAGGSLMAITVKADEDFAGTAHVDFTNVRVVSSDIVETTLADASAFVIGGAYDINEATATAVKVYTDGQRIIIESPIAQAAAVVSVSGATQQVELVAGKNEVNVAAQGIYLVRIGSKNYKVKL